MEHVFRLVEETRMGYIKKWNGWAIFIDAIGMAWRAQIPADERQLIQEDDQADIIITNRTIDCCNYCSDEVTLNAGTPQGSVLYPILFIIYVNDIADIRSLNTRLSRFADDMGIWTHAPSAKWTKAKLCKALKLMEE